MRGRSPRHRGVHVGRVLSTNKGTLIIQVDEEKYGQFEPPLKRGDGIVVDRGVSNHINDFSCWCSERMATYLTINISYHA